VFDGPDVLLKLPVNTAFILLIATGVAELQRAPGRPVAGLQAAILLVTEATPGSLVPVTLKLCNITSEEIPIDKWRGLWFVDVRDSSGRAVRHTRAIDILRPITRPEPLPPASCWNTELEGLCLVAGSAGSTPLWRYEPLEAGVYTLRAEYRSWDRPMHSRFKEHHPDWPIPWSGEVLSGEAVLSVR
jgi:hypothetical protein